MPIIIQYSLLTVYQKSLIFGPPAYLPSDVKKLSMSLQPIWNIFSGGDIPKPLAGSGTACDVRDVARLFVFAADHPDKADGERYNVVSGIAHPQAITDVLREGFPERSAVIQVGQPGVGYPKSLWNNRIDGSKAVRATGEDYVNFKESIIDTARALTPYL